MKKKVTEKEFSESLDVGTTLLHGQYTIEKFLNSGGFGITYLARTSLDRPVVIKECFPGAICRRQDKKVSARSKSHVDGFDSALKTFVREAKNLSKLSHPNIVGVHQVFEENDTAYMVIDYVEGRDLQEMIEDRKTKLKPDFMISTTIKILTAIKTMHDQDILHRDISPDNVLINEHNEPILIDFGAAREEASKNSRVLSTINIIKDGYSPQEFYISGSIQNNSSDLYALAASLYHCIAGEMVPNSQIRLASLAEGTSNPYKPLAENFSNYPDEFLRAIDVALNVIPNQRLQSAEEWLEMIGASDAIKPVAVAGASLNGAGGSKANPFADLTKNVPLMAGAAAAVVVLGGGILFFTGGSDEPPPETNAATAVLEKEDPVEVAQEEIKPESVEPQDDGQINIQDALQQMEKIANAKAMEELEPVPEDVTVAEEVQEDAAKVDEAVTETPEQTAEVTEPEEVELEKPVVVTETETVTEPEVAEVVEPEVAKAEEPEVVESAEPEIVDEAEPEIAEVVEPEIVEPEPEVVAREIIAPEPQIAAPDVVEPDVAEPVATAEVETTVSPDAETAVEETPEQEPEDVAEMIVAAVKDAVVDTTPEAPQDDATAQTNVAEAAPEVSATEEILEQTESVVAETEPEATPESAVVEPTEPEQPVLTVEEPEPEVQVTEAPTDVTPVDVAEVAPEPVPAPAAQSGEQTFSELWNNAAENIPDSVDESNIPIFELIPAPSEPEQVDVAAVQPEPEVATPEQPEIQLIPVQPEVDSKNWEFSASDWQLEIPFGVGVPISTDANQQSSGFPLIISVAPDIDYGFTGDWVNPGVVIYAINGELITSAPRFVGFLNGVFADRAPDTVRATLRIARIPNAKAEDVVLQMAFTNEVTFENGLVLEQRLRQDVWQLVVVTPAINDPDGLQVGDVIVSERSLGQPIASAQQLSSTFKRIQVTGAGAVEFNIIRQGTEQLIKSKI